MKQSTGQSTINLKELETPIGTIVVCATDKGICLLEFADIEGIQKEYDHLSKEKNAVFVPGENKHITQLKEELKKYFEGELITFSVALDLIGTTFQQQVWHGLLHIPYGETKSYKEQSEYLQIPKSIRAVANANGMNRIAIVIPCHRIIGTDGSLTGYRGGIWRKKFLLELENKERFSSSQLTLSLY
ncbi:Methylated DNA-protein cysteine methyltransferase [Myroides sp. A21]|uniref:methylated-DNA--[protein]-cysteine S-methyltransferase n=1 Tax=Myroides sp. A21 TaxID=1583100 RepID=UPI00057E5ECA|nr:methylated-DNA--[protein]-cysteine S-methyltransferase [Myroides sp. A21]AJA70661.1 Methylated DNA-protein cysteine methyltransferase [Myroides sp. A21]